MAEAALSTSGTGSRGVGSGVEATLLTSGAGSGVGSGVEATLLTSGAGSGVG